ncbi:extracellular solute-binding protein [Paenibacillus sp. Marseille-Q7038]
MNVSKKKGLFKFLSVFLIISILAACSSNGGDDSSDSATDDPGAIKGEITVITQRTDIVDTVFKDYAAKFNEKYPDVKVNFEALSDYEGQIKIRMNTDEYGDVLLIPTSVPVADLPSFFEPLGSYDEMKTKYTGIEERMVDNTIYGIPVAITYSGVIYNKQVFKDAGITEVPQTIDQFMEALRSVKAKTDATPLYTNYAAGWPLTQWESDLTSVAGDVDYVNVTQPNSDENFVAGQPHYDLYKILFDATKEGLIERDPTTTDWESSKADLGQGKIATMVLGSWAIDQIKASATNPDDIGFMPFPTNADKVIVPLGADYNLAINVNSKNKAAAKAWVDFFIHESNYAVEQAGSISAVVGAELPEILKEYGDKGVEFKTITASKEGQEGLVDKIDKEAEVGLWQPDFKKRIIEAALGNRKESFDDIMKDLNDAWIEARKTVAE